MITTKMLNIALKTNSSMANWNLGISIGTEAAIGGVLQKKVFLEISQDLQENTCAWVSFLIKLQALGLNFQEHLFYKTSLDDCFCRQANFNTDVFKTSSGRIRKVMTLYDQTRHRHEVLQKTSYLCRLKDVWFTTSVEDALFTTFWRRLIYDVYKTTSL